MFKKKENQSADDSFLFRRGNKNIHRRRYGEYTEAKFEAVTKAKAIQRLVHLEIQLQPTNPDNIEDAKKYLVAGA